jgi:crotonyl-CoA carboxylase/reductase
MQLGAKGVINRNEFDCWGQMPAVGTPEVQRRGMKKAREFGKAIWHITGKGNDVDIVFEHPGEADLPRLGADGEARRHGGHLCRHHRLQPHHGRALTCGCARSACRARISPICMQAEPGQPAGHRRAASIRACREAIPGPTSQGPHEDVEEPAPARQHGRVLVSAPTTGLKTLDDAIEASAR